YLCCGRPSHSYTSNSASSASTPSRPTIAHRFLLNLSKVEHEEGNHTLRLRLVRQVQIERAHSVNRCSARIVRFKRRWVRYGSDNDRIQSKEISHRFARMTQIRREGKTIFNVRGHSVRYGSGS